MRFRLYLKPLRDGQQLLFNYQYPLQSWLYGLLRNADETYATFLHQTGYTVLNRRKSFKHFTFSALQIPRTEKIKPGDTYMVLRSDLLTLVVSFYVDQAAENFIVGLFQNQRLSLFNRDHRADFVVERVETLPDRIEGAGNQTLRLQTLSPLVVSEKENGLDQYLAPTDEAFGRLLALNLVDKYRSVAPDRLPEMDAYLAERLVQFRLLPEQNRIKVRKMKIKENKEAETKVVGYHNFHFELIAPPELLEVGYFGGLGRYNAMGCGCVEVVEERSG
ncbi:CRISPR-associated endoribonuclease Cas6 [Telluribacter sp.]|uniref:CRISPR-associated endoribonuclease Cas6 n=1 Tax=Telluribacter sp. TaxID=1978767 RepID=UPI002E11CA58|nr:CRISPR-associated endoribonuclease Cas6 [Telluribacter sp.]